MQIYNFLINLMGISLEEAPENIESVEIQNLSFRFVGRKPLLKNISLSIEKGKITVLMGEVGCGKSLVIQILQQFQQFESGQILINHSMNLNDISPKSWRNIIGVVPQEVKIFNATLMENIILGDTGEQGQEAAQFCNNIGIDTFFQQLPQGYFTVVGEEGINLSGGQRQIIALARALYRKPQLLLLDEATSAMDSQTEQFVLSLLDKLKPEMGILMVTHRHSIAQNADKVYNLSD